MANPTTPVSSRPVSSREDRESGLLPVTGTGPAVTDRELGVTNTGGVPQSMLGEFVASLKESSPEQALLLWEGMGRITPTRPAFNMERVREQVSGIDPTALAVIPHRLLFPHGTLNAPPEPTSERFDKGLASGALDQALGVHFSPGEGELEGITPPEFLFSASDIVDPVKGAISTATDAVGITDTSQRVGRGGKRLSEGGRPLPSGGVEPIDIPNAAGRVAVLIAELMPAGKGVKVAKEGVSRVRKVLSNIELGNPLFHTAIQGIGKTISNIYHGAEALTQNEIAELTAQMLFARILPRDVGVQLAKGKNPSSILADSRLRVERTARASPFPKMDEPERFVPDDPKVFKEFVDNIKEYFNRPAVPDIIGAPTSRRLAAPANPNELPFIKPRFEESGGRFRLQHGTVEPQGVSAAGLERNIRETAEGMSEHAKRVADEVTAGVTQMERDMLNASRQIPARTSPRNPNFSPARRPEDLVKTRFKSLPTDQGKIAHIPDDKPGFRVRSSTPGTSRGDVSLSSPRARSAASAERGAATEPFQPGRSTHRAGSAQASALIQQNPAALNKLKKNDLIQLAGTMKVEGDLRRMTKAQLSEALIERAGVTPTASRLPFVPREFEGGHAKSVHKRLKTIVGKSRRPKGVQPGSSKKAGSTKGVAKKVKKTGSGTGKETNDGS